MGVYSTVMIMLEKTLNDEILNSYPDIAEWLQQSDRKKVSEKGVRYDFKMTKWYEFDEDTEEAEFHDLLEKLNPDGKRYAIWKFTSEYMFDGYCPLDQWGNFFDPEIYPYFHPTWE